MARWRGPTAFSEASARARGEVGAGRWAQTESEAGAGPAAERRRDAGRDLSMPGGTAPERLAGPRASGPPPPGPGDRLRGQMRPETPASEPAPGAQPQRTARPKQSLGRMIMVVQEMKKYFPSETRNKPSTLDALNYALRCVHSVQASREFFQVPSRNGAPRADVTTYSLEELASWLRAHFQKHGRLCGRVFTGVWAGGAHLRAGAFVLSCRRESLASSPFDELLAPKM